MTAQGDWGDASFQWGEGYQTRTGILRVEPYPVLYLPPDAEHPRGRAIPLSGEGKRGVREKAAGLDGKAVDVGGFLLRAGDREMLQVGGELDDTARYVELSGTVERRADLLVFRVDPASLRPL